ncbi:efflux transporter outer membrane subunit [Algibacillus agarilyticus]|uniref:efflux transporter outer membrane subunit n=1 Tax=Algibacillus agarilyticus TaxID=2234133 RepID=UPI000DD02646|nr:efflux transporter outer membrane subunit [Algibacillus agarilyticus]
MNKLFTAFGVVIIFFSFSACSFKPELTITPTLAVQNNWHETYEQQSSLALQTENQAALAWIKPLLDDNSYQLVLQAIRQNLNLRQSAASLVQAKLNIDIEESQYLPNLDGRFFASRNDSGDNNYGLALSSGVSLDVWGQLSERVQQKIIQFEQQSIRYYQQQFEFSVSLVTHYLKLKKTEQIIALLEQRLINVKSQLSSAEEQYKAGLVNLANVYQARNNVQGVKGQLLREKNSLKRLSHELPLLFGLPPMAISHRVKAFTLPDELPVLPRILPADLLTLRADIRLAWLDVLKQQSEVAIAYANRFPRFSLSANASSSSDSLSDLVKLGDIGWNLGANIAGPIFNAGRLKNKAKQAQIDLDKTEYRYKNTAYNAFKQVENLFSQRELTQLENMLNEQTYQNVEQALTLAQRQYQQGLIEYKDYLANQRNFFSAQISQLNLQYQQIFDHLNLLVALGGGWAVELNVEANNER